MKKRKTLLALGSLALVAALAVGSTLAYLTDTTEATANNFTVGKVDITVEEKWEEPEEPIKPGDEKEKEPTIKSTNESEASYVFMKVAVPFVENGTVLNSDGTKDTSITDQYVDYFDLIGLNGNASNDHWVRIDSATVHDAEAKKNIYVYAYAANNNTLTTLEKGAETEPLFTKIKLRNILELAPNGTESIDVSGYAIQTANIDSTVPAVVWSYIMNQEALTPASGGSTVTPTPGGNTETPGE